MAVERIVAATDFSRTAEAATRRAALLAKACGASLEVVHTVHLPPLADAWRKLVAGEGITDETLRAGALARLDEQAAALEKRTGVKPATRLLEGKPPQALADWTRQCAADLVVVGAHGEHLLLDLFVGSTAQKLLRLASQPVLLVKQTPPFEYERILIATDFSPAGRAAAEFAARVFDAAELYLFHTYEAPFERQMYYAGADDEAVDHYRRLGEAEARRQMDEFVASLSAPQRYARKVRHGYAPTLINQYAAELGADLLVVGSHRQSELAAALLGSVAAHLVNESRDDVLLVPTLS
jgi:nucleotide-binding universal stress UspA family protein